MAITLRINGVDFSSYIEKTQDISESMRKVYGKANATGLDGTQIPNLVAVKWDPSFRTRPMPQDMAKRLFRHPPGSSFQRSNSLRRFTSHRSMRGCMKRRRRIAL